MADDIVIHSLLAAIEAQPESLELRLHVAELLVRAERNQEAIPHLEAVLAKEPTNITALRLAVPVFRESGDLARSVAFEQILNALQMQSAQRLIESTPPPPEEPERLRMSYDGEQPGDADDSAMSKEFDFAMERPEIDLRDVKGLAEVKERINLSFLGPLRNPELRKLYGKSLKGGLLMYGPPGCGKTFIARAIAGELGARFLTVSFADVVDMWIGSSEKNLHALFESARRNNPCVIFIDEIDALGRKRNLMRHSAGSTLINQLLSELDGAQYNNEGVYIIGATNHPWDVDVALRRPGRLDRTILVLPPDAPARAEIIAANLEERPTQNIDANWIAKETDGFSGADMAHIVETASEFALADSIRTNKVRPIDMSDMKRALKQVRPTTGTWFETAKNHAIFSNEGGYYDDLLDYLKKKRMI